jgi:hypothetical protein
MRVTTRKMLRLQLWILTGVLGCDANTVGLLTGCLPFAIPGLTTDAGAPPVVPITGGSFDAAGFFEDPDGGVAAAGEACGASRGCDTAAGLDCVGVTQEDSVCLQRCGALDACPNGLACEVLSSGRYCLSVVGRGAACEVARCDPTNGLGCLPARAEGAQLLATTCQLPCDVAAPTCPSMSPACPTWRVPWTGLVHAPVAPGKPAFRWTAAAGVRCQKTCAGRWPRCQTPRCLENRPRGRSTARVTRAPASACVAGRWMAARAWCVHNPRLPRSPPASRGLFPPVSPGCAWPSAGTRSPVARRRARQGGRAMWIFARCSMCRTAPGRVTR